MLLLAACSFGCAHKYSQEEYRSVVSELEACKAELRTFKDENVNVSKRLSEMQQKLDQTTQTLASSINEKQELLDRNIQCLEEKKALLKKISQSSLAGQEKKEVQLRMSKGYEFIISFLEAERLSDQLYIIRTQDKIKVVVPQRSLFPTPGSAWLTPKGTKLIKKIALAVKQMAPLAVEIAGHTDNAFVPDPKINAYQSNWHLAHARALAVLTVFDESKIKNDRMCAVSYGETKPIADNATQDGKSMNRRVEILITP